MQNVQTSRIGRRKKCLPRIYSIRTKKKERKSLTLPSLLTHFWNPWEYPADCEADLYLTGSSTGNQGIAENWFYSYIYVHREVIRDTRQNVRSASLWLLQCILFHVINRLSSAEQPDLVKAPWMDCYNILCWLSFCLSVQVLFTHFFSTWPETL